MNDFELRVTGDTVTLIEHRPVKVADLEEFLTALSADAGHSTGIVPPGTRMVVSRGQMTMVLMEATPRMTSIVTPAARFTLSLPFVQYYLKVQKTAGEYVVADSYVSCTRRPVMDEEDAVYQLPLPNVWDTGRVCTGSMKCGRGTLSSVCRDYIAAFLGSGFNWDLAVSFPAFSARDVKGRTAVVQLLSKWHEASVDNPLWGVCDKAIYSPHRHHTVKGVVNACVRY